MAAPDSATYLQIARPVDLRNCLGTRLRFSHSYATERGFDHCYVEARTKGQPWTVVARFSGLQREFVPQEIDLSAFDGAPKVKLRFAVRSDRIIPSDGWYVDNIEITTGQAFVAR